MSTSTSVIIGDNSNAVHWKKANPYDVNKDPLALAPVSWSPQRPKPDFISGIWGDLEIEDLSRYVDWHRQHPHCVTPRPLKPDEEFLTVDKKLDEGNPKLVFTKVPGHIPPTPKEFQPPPLGGDCDTDSISVVAMEKEYEQIIYNKYEREDPWYDMSVKDQLEQFHIDGSHTTVRTKRSTASSAVSAFSKEAAWLKETYGNYEGGYPTVKPQQLDQLEQLALRDKTVLHDAGAAPKLGPWEVRRSFTQYTKAGTALKEYDVLALERNILAALAEHEAELKAERASARSASSRSRKSKKHRRKSKNKVVPEETLDKFESMRRKVGTHKEIEKMTRGFVRLAKKVSKHSKLQKNALETRMDLVEACNKLRVLKVNAMLLLESTNANMKTPEEEPILLHMFMKAVRMDQISGHQRLGSEDHDTPDRAKVTQVLQALLGRADPNILGREGITAAHMAAMGDSSRLMQLLSQFKADFEVFSTHDEWGMTPLMLAAKYGNVYVCADLVRSRVDIDKVNKAGMSALHCAGMFGQTRTAKFLLRVGANKFLKDNEGNTAARVAMDCGYMATGQAIAAFARKQRDVASQLQYLVEQEEKRLNKAPGGLLGALSRMKSFLNSLTVSNLRSQLSAVGKHLYKQLRRCFVYLRREFCEYFEIDFDPGKDGTGSDSGSEDEDEEEEEGDLEAAGQADVSESGDCSDSTKSRRDYSCGSSTAGGGGGGQESDSADVTPTVPLFARTAPQTQLGDVIGFHDKF